MIDIKFKIKTGSEIFFTDASTARQWVPYLSVIETIKKHKELLKTACCPICDNKFPEPFEVTTCEWCRKRNEICRYESQRHRLYNRRNIR